MPSSEPLQIFTYQTRLDSDAFTDEAMESFAKLFGKVERKLFAAIASGKNATDLKSSFQKEYGITARQFNAIRVQLEGKIASFTEKRAGQIVTMQQKIASVQSTVKKLQKRAPHSEKCHQKKRLQFNLENRLAKLKQDESSGRISLCFGSKRLFRAQFALAANGYDNQAEWLRCWKQSRDDSFFLLGSKDESSGNQSCTATIAEDGSLSLRIRLPDALLKKYGKYLTLSGIHFQYGHQNIIAALQSCERRKQLQALKDPQGRSSGLPISYRFKCDQKGWRIFVSVPVAKSHPATSSQKGVIGVDINADHLAFAETDRFGNPIAKKSIPLTTYGKNRNQAKALIGKTCTALIAYAKQRGKTLVIENLDFRKKKAELKEYAHPAYARMLSSMAYTQIKGHLKAKGWREGVEVVEINPAFTSLIGRIKFARRYGLSVHQSAALAIGRRHLRVSEKIPRRLEAIPDGKEGFVAFSLPVRNREKHVWSIWRILGRKLKTALAAHFRAIANRSMSSQPASVISNIPEYVGETPTRESVNTTARLACLNSSTDICV